MKPDPAANPPPLTDSPAHLRRAARLVEALRTALSHDLPNDLVAIQGLLQILELEEAANFRQNGQDYLRRLKNATQRAQGRVTLLKDLSRLGAEAAPVERVQLADVLNELRAAMNQLFPTHVIEYHFEGETATVLVPRRTLYQTLLQMARVLLASVGPGLQRFHCQGRLAEDEVELTAYLRRLNKPTDATPPVITEYSLAQRLDVVLARELADSGGCRLSATPDADCGLRLTLTLPAA